MNKKFKTIEEFLNYLSATITNFSTPLVNILENSENQIITKLQGSGTFIRVGDLFGILTAFHVAEELKKGFAIGLNIYSDENGQSYNILRENIVIFDIANHVENKYGPDISFLRLPNESIGILKANKSFYDLSLHHINYQTFIENINNHKHYASWGVLGELNSNEPPERGFENVIGLHQYCMLSTLKEYLTRGDHDYLELDIDYTFVSPKFPKTLRGVSGGGIWMIDFNTDNENNEINLSNYFYCGISFFETKITEDNHRSIRGHSWKSIYSIAYHAIVNNFK